MLCDWVEMVFRFILTMFVKEKDVEIYDSKMNKWMEKVEQDWMV